MIGKLFLFKDIGLKVLTISLLGLLTYINYRSINFSAGLQRLLTSLKVIAIFTVIFGLFSSDKGSVSNLIVQNNILSFHWTSVTLYASALTAAFWAYDGWNNITFIAGEITEPQRNIPKSLFIGMGICIITYMLINASILYIFPIDQIAKSKAIAADTASFIWGDIGGAAIAFLIMLAVLGTVNANVFSTARVTFAMSNDNIYFKSASKIHPKYHSPSNALLINFIWSAILVFSGSFDMLTDMLIFVTWFFYGASALGLFVLRYKMPNTYRPYRVIAYPVVPLIFIAFTFCFLCITLVDDIHRYINGQTAIMNSVLGVAITLIGLFFYKKS